MESKAKQISTNWIFLVSINQAFTKNLVIIYEWKLGYKHPKKLCVSRVDLAEILLGYWFMFYATLD
jgi:hypothetical protein